MAGLIIPARPEELAPSKAPQPFTPKHLNGLSEEERKSPEMQEFRRRMNNSGSEHVNWFVWRY